MINQITKPIFSEIICQIILKNQNNIANGIIPPTNIFAIGARIDICQKLKIIIGRVVVIADMVKTNHSLRAKKLGIDLKMWFQKFWKYKSPKTARKLKWKDIS